MAIVLEDHIELAAVDAARSVDLLDGEISAITSAESDISSRPGDRPEGADRDGVLGHPRLCGVCRPRQRQHQSRSGEQTEKPLPKHRILPMFLTERSVNCINFPFFLESS
jgi:hypothetical protein